jgi:hypothetical protein
MKRIALRGEKGAGVYALVDDEDFDRLVEFAWYYHSAGYAVRNYVSNGKRKSVLMHREVMNAPKDMLVDHRDRNRLNNTKENLRVTTHDKNQMNRVGSKYRTADCASKYKGVHFNGISWVARIKLDGEQQTIGHYATEDEAGKAYDEKAIELFGEFAYLNGISEDIVPVPLKKGATSEYRGVIAWKGKWRAGCNQIHLGTFEDEIEAADAYNKKAREVFGPLAILNEIPEDWTPKPKKYRGVYYRGKGSGENYEANVYEKLPNGKHKGHYCGKFSTAEEAAMAYNKKAIEIHGDKAKLNVV